MDDTDWLAQRFESHRPHLRAVAYRMLGSVSEAEDAVQEAWLRLSRSDRGDNSDGVGIENLGGWLTTVVGRVCLNQLRARRSRREEPWDSRVPDPIVSTAATAAGPEDEALLADSIGLALLVVLDTLTPAERLAFVLHDMFAVPFNEIAQILGRSQAAARQLASRARRRVRGSAPVPDPDLARQREVVEAFLAASREGDFQALLAVLDPEVVLRADLGAMPVGTAPPVGTARQARGAETVARQALSFSRFAPFARLVLVNGSAGLLVTRGEEPISIMAFTIRAGRIVELDIVADRTRLRRLLARVQLE